MNMLEDTEPLSLVSAEVTSTEVTAEVLPEIDRATVLKRFGEAQTAREKFEKDWRVYIDKYDGKVLYAKKDWQSDVSVPEIFKAVKALVSHEMKEYWGRKFWMLEAANPEDDKVAQKKDRLAEIRVMSYPHRMRIWEQTATDKYLIGAGVVKQWWEGGWRFGNVSPFNFYPEPGKESVDACMYVFHEDIMSKGAARDMFDRGVWTTKFEGDAATVNMMLEGTAATTKGQEKGGDTADMGDSVHVLEYWEDDVLCVVLNKKWLVRKSKNPYDVRNRFGEKRKPFLALHCGVSRNSFWGAPIPYNVWNLCDKMDRHFNMALDLSRLLINPPRKFGLGAGVLSDAVMDISPGRIARVQRINEEQVEKFDGAVPANNVAISLLKNAASDTHGVTDTVIGQETPSSNDTAMGKGLVSEAASKRIELYTYQNEDFCMDFINMWSDIERQFMGEAIQIKMRDVRRKYYVDTINQDEMMKPVDIIIRPPRQMVNRMAQLQNEILKYNTLYANGSIDKTVLARRLLEAFDDRNVDELILNEDEMVEKAVEAAMVEIRAKGAIAGQAPVQPEAATIPGQVEQPLQMTDQRVITQ